MRGGATCNSAVARRTRSTIARVCREAAADHDEEPDRAEEVTATPNSRRSGSIASQGPVVVSPGNVNSAGSQTSNAQATGAVGASQGRASNKRKLTSIVWEGNFENFFIDGEWKAECMYCHKLLTAKGTSGTSHLKSHMSSCGARHAPIGPKQQKLRLTKVDDGKANLENTIFDQDVARKELALMICLHEYPLSMVDHSGFRKFCSTLQPMFRMVSRNNIRTDILDMYAAEKDKMVKYFANFKNRVAITTDMWTAKYQKRGYMVVTAHFIDEFWQLKSFILRFVYVPSPHNAAVICEALRESLVEWHLERKISTVTLDNCTPNDKAMEHLPDKLDSDSLILEGKYLHMRCATHILNLIVKDGMDVMEEGIERVRDSVGFWSATPKRHEKFEKMARTLNIEYKKRLALDCKTRWNSTYTMLTIALEYIEVFEKLKAREKLFSCCPTKDDWKVAKELCDRPKNFFDITEAFSGSKYVTANLFFPKICGIQLAIQKWATSDNEVVQKMSEEMKLKFDKYWKDVHGLMSVATILDPRYKLHMLQALFGSLYGMEYAAVKVAEIRNLMADLLEQYREDDEATATSEVVSTAAAQVAGIDDVMNIFDKYMSS